MTHEADEVVVLDPAVLDVTVLDAELCAPLVDEKDLELVWLEEEDVGLAELVRAVSAVCEVWEVVPTDGGIVRK